MAFFIAAFVCVGMKDCGSSVLKALVLLVMCLPFLICSGRINFYLQIQNLLREKNATEEIVKGLIDILLGCIEIKLHVIKYIYKYT